MATATHGDGWDRRAVRPTRFDLAVLFAVVTVGYAALTRAIDPANLASALVLGPASGLVAAWGCAERARRNRRLLSWCSEDEQVAIHRAMRTGVAPDDRALDVDVRLVLGEQRLSPGARWLRLGSGRLDGLERQLDERAGGASGSTGYAPASRST